MKDYLPAAKGLLIKPKVFVANLPKAVDVKFWTFFLIATFLVTQIGVMIDAVFVSGKGWGDLAACSLRMPCSTYSHRCCCTLQYGCSGGRDGLHRPCGL